MECRSLGFGICSYKRKHHLLWLEDHINPLYWSGICFIFVLWTERTLVEEYTFKVKIWIVLSSWYSWPRLVATNHFHLSTMNTKTIFMATVAVSSSWSFFPLWKSDIQYNILNAFSINGTVYCTQSNINKWLDSNQPFWFINYMYIL